MRNKKLIIAEIGVNHNGEIELAKKQIKLAKEAGADIVKFQTYITEELVTRSANKADYQKKYESSSEDQFSMLKKFEFSYDQFTELSEFSSKVNIEFLSTAFDLTSLSFLKSIGIKRIKVPSGEVDNLAFLEELPAYELPIILSTGMSTLEEVKRAVAILTNGGVDKEDITVMHCTSEYPAALETINLRVIETLRKELQLEIGYSDHSEGIVVPAAAFSMGVRVIEKHFTSSKELMGPDQKASLDPAEFKRMIKTFNNIELASGSNIKQPSPVEERNKISIRRSIVAKTPIKKGDIFTEGNLALKRPGDGIPASKWFDVVGKKSKSEYRIDDKISIDEK